MITPSSSIANALKAARPVFGQETSVTTNAAKRWVTLFRGLMVLGAVTFAAGAFLGGNSFWAGLLLVSVFLVGLGLAGTALIAFEYLTGAGWSVACRRVPEAMTSFIPLGGVGIALTLLLHPSLYPWTGHHGADMAGFRGVWLNRGFFLARSAVYLVTWIILARALVRNSRQQDRTGNARLSDLNTILSGAFVVVFALTCWLASVDWLMTLEPEWFSTIFGIYNFSGIMTSGIAGVILFGSWLRRLGPWRGVFTEEHLHDLGKLLLTFCTFWAYIWFSQYMLIWYANIPEESVYYVRRVQGAWGSLVIVNLLLNWAIPFFLLLPRACKRDIRIMTQVAIVVLAGRLLDLYLMIVPSQPGASPVPSFWMVGLTLGMVGLAGAVFLHNIRQAPVVPVHDPHLGESLSYRI